MPDNRILPLLCFSVFFLFSVKELLTESPHVEKEIPETRMGLSNSGAPTIKIFYCHSCGYQRAFQDYSKVLLERYPTFKVEGEHYEPHQIFSLCARLLVLSKIVVIMMIASNRSLLSFCGIADPVWWRWCLDNKVYACLAIFFISNMLENMLISSGAFEIVFNGIPVWSKLERKRVPLPEELFHIIESHLNFKRPVSPFEGEAFAVNE